MPVATLGATRTSTGNYAFTGTCVTHVTFRETGNASASFTLRADSSGGRVMVDRNLYAQESDSESFDTNPVGLQDKTTGTFHLTVNSGAVTVSILGY